MKRTKDEKQSREGVRKSNLGNGILLKRRPHPGQDDF